MDRSSTIFSLREVHLTTVITRYRDTILLTAGQAVSQFGSSLTNVAFIFWIKEHFNSGTVMGIFFLAATLSAACMSLVAGPVIDRWIKVRLLIVMDVIAAVVMVALIVAFSLTWTGIAALTVVVCGKVLLSLLYGLRQPAFSAAIGEINVEPDFSRANSIFYSGRQLAIILSEAASGLVYVSLGLDF